MIMGRGPLPPPPDIVRSAYAELIVTDLARARWFWVDVLGFVVTESGPGALYLRGYDELTHHNLILRAGGEPAAARLALRVRAALNALGVRTAMSRGNDNALGPCVDERANMANALRPNAILSIHGDGGPPSGRGFHVNYSSPPLNAAQSGPSRRVDRSQRI